MLHWFHLEGSEGWHREIVEIIRRSIRPFARRTRLRPSQLVFLRIHCPFSNRQSIVPLNSHYCKEIDQGVSRRDEGVPYRVPTRSGTYFCEKRSCSVRKPFSRVFKLKQREGNGKRLGNRLILLFVSQFFYAGIQLFIETIGREDDFVRRRHTR